MRAAAALCTTSLARLQRRCCTPALGYQDAQALHAAALSLPCRQDEFAATGVSGELFSTIDKAGLERSDWPGIAPNLLDVAAHALLVRAAMQAPAAATRLCKLGLSLAGRAAGLAPAAWAGCSLPEH